MRKIYLLEDDDNIRKLVCYALSREEFEVKGFAAPEEFWGEYNKAKPDLILLDIMLPNEDGLSILKKIRVLDNKTAVIMLTAKDSEYDKVTGLDLGADDYIAKPFGMSELISRVNAVLRRYGCAPDNEKIYRIGELAVYPARRMATLSGKELALSYKEFELLIVLLEADGKAVTREELFTRVWGEFYGESRTLDVHIRNLRSKLGAEGNCIQTIKNVGYRIGRKDD